MVFVHTYFNNVSVVLGLFLTQRPACTKSTNSQCCPHRRSESSASTGGTGFMRFLGTLAAWHKDTVRFNDVRVVFPNGRYTAMELRNGCRTP